MHPIIKRKEKKKKKKYCLKGIERFMIGSGRKRGLGKKKKDGSKSQKGRENGAKKVP